VAEFDTLLKGGTVVGEYGNDRFDIGISSGKIAAVGADLGDSATETLDLGGCLILPGGIDPHVHFNEPGRTHWEGWATGSRALAAGGATSCIEMPLNAHPPTLDRESFNAKRAAAEASSIVDFALWGGLTPVNVDRMEELAECGVIGFKAFLSHSGMDDFQAADDLTLFRGMEKAVKFALPVAVHAENDGITAGLAAAAIARGKVTPRDYLNSRPVVAELEAVNRCLLLARETGCALHIVHVSSGKAVALIAEARATGVDVTCETCPHYLLFTGEDMERVGAALKCAPPLRDTSTREDLWTMVKSGEVDMIASDHSPSPPEMKQADTVFEAWGGISGCQHTRAAMFTGGKKRRLSPSQIAQMTAGSVASRFRLAGKGRIAVGYDADLSWGAMQPDRPIAASDVHYRYPDSPWNDLEFSYRHLGTMLRGSLIFRGGVFPDGARGRFLRPA